MLLFEENVHVEISKAVSYYAASETGNLYAILKGNRMTTRSSMHEKEVETNGPPSHIDNLMKQKNHNSTKVSIPGHQHLQ